MQVAEAHCVKRIYAFKVDGRGEGVAAEHNLAALSEAEFLFNHVLDSEPVRSLCHKVVAKHLEGTLVVVVRPNVACAVERYLVACLLVHQHTEGKVGRGVDS